MENLPAYIDWVFILTVVLAVLLFYKATDNSKVTLIILTVLVVVQSIVSVTGFYKVTNPAPPRFVMLLLPPVLLIALLFATNKGRWFIDRLDIKLLTIFHIIRVPVEMVLFWLYLHKAVPKLITFEGGNFDIFSGLTAPFIYYFGFVKQRISRGLIIAWNFVCLALLINVVVHAVLSAPLPLQEFAFDQPNIAILYFPFVLLPGCLVPLVLLCHLAAVRQLVRGGE
jgi:hypothetical protein